MGLSINRYYYPYGFLQALRRAALEVEGNQLSLSCIAVIGGSQCGICFYCKKAKGVAKTKFEEFIWHSDCDEGYISKKSKQYKKYKEKGYGDLDKLKKECEILNKKIKKFLIGRHQEAWDDYYKDISSAKMLLHYR